MQEYMMLSGSIILVCTSVFNLNSFKFKIKEILLMAVLAEGIALVLVHTSEFASIIPMIIIPSIFIYKSSKNVVRSISIPVVSVLIIVIADYLISNIYVSISGIDIDIVRDNVKLYWLLIGIEFILVYLSTKFFGFFINKKAKIAELELKGKFGLLIIASLLLTLIIFYTNIVFQSKSGSSNEIIRLNGILFFAYFVLLMIIIYILLKSITKEMKFKNEQVQLENLQEYTSNLEKLYSDMRAFRHDYINILSSMIGYIQNKDMNGLEKHFNEKIAPLSKGMESNNFKIGLLKNIEIPEFKGIFSSKLIRAQELGIDVFVDIMEPIEKVNIDIIDLSRVVGILLDNAIEAAEVCEEPSMKVAIINKENSVLIVIINSLKEEVPIYKIYQKGYSTKGDNRGLGLYNLKEIIGKYVNVSLDTLIEDRDFKQLLEITNK